MMTTTARSRVVLGGVILASVLVAGCSSTSSPTSPTVTGTPPVIDTPTTPAPPPVVETPAPAPTPPPPPQTARYRFTFDALWSAATHPQDFPGDPHFSPLVGATHLATTRFWQEGAVATDGIRDMAERGLTIRLSDEIRAAIAAGTAQNLLLGGNIRVSPGSVSLEFDVSRDHPAVTLVSMVAPSPDWFTGVSALRLFDNGQWVDRRVLDLGPWDAGTDSGRTFSSADEATTPRAAVSPIRGFPFLLNGQVLPIARFTFERLP